MLTIILIAYAVIGVSLVAALVGYAGAIYKDALVLDPVKLVMLVLFWPIFVVICGVGAIWE